MFVKFRTRDASGHGHWEYREIDEEYYSSKDECMQDFAESIINSEYYWSDLHRGVDVEEVVPSADWLEGLITSAKAQISELQERIEGYEKLLPIAPREPKRDCEHCIQGRVLYPGENFCRMVCKAGNRAYLTNESITWDRDLTCRDFKSDPTENEFAKNWRK